MSIPSFAAYHSPRLPRFLCPVLAFLLGRCSLSSPGVGDPASDHLVWPETDLPSRGSPSACPRHPHLALSGRGGGDPSSGLRGWRPSLGELTLWSLGSRHPCPARTQSLNARPRALPGDFLHSSGLCCDRWHLWLDGVGLLFSFLLCALTLPRGAGTF